jgi:hypothetical protein
MQSEWYKKQLEDGVIDHTGALTIVFQEEKVAELEAQDFKMLSAPQETNTPH